MLRVLALHEFEKLERALEQVPHIFDEEIERGALEASIVVSRKVKDFTPVGVSRGGGEGLQASIRYQIYPTAGEVAGVISSPLNYVEAVEIGTRPHMPPVESLREWAESKGLSAWAVAKSIAKHGTKGQWMFKKGFEASEPALEQVANRVVSRILQRADAL
jgi:hypothetical protein